MIKWAGGKRWLAPLVADLYRASGGGRLVEPFFGGGAVFFEVGARDASVSDANAELIGTYREIRDSPERVAASLAKWPTDRDTFYRLRAHRPSSSVERAARFIYLNRTAFNGLYRVNRAGDFNVPYGCKPGTRMPSAETLVAVSWALRRAQIDVCDFRQALERCAPADFVYLDPPYTVRHNQNGFNRYNERLFTWADQEALAARSTELVVQGGRVVVSNANHESVRGLYSSELFTQRVVSRSTRMAASTAHRGTTTELLLIGRGLEPPG